MPTVLPAPPATRVFDRHAPARLRARYNWTQETAARKCGLSLHTYTDYEQGERRPGSDNLARLAAGLGVPIDALFKDTP